MNFSTQQRPTIEIGSLNLMKSERDVSRMDNNIFHSDRILRPSYDKSYKLIQNKNSK